MKSKDIKVINFFEKINDLQKTTRYNDYPNFQENTSAHTFKVILMVDYLYKYLNLSLDYEKCIELAIYHDFGEMDLVHDVDIKGNNNLDVRNEKEVYETNKIEELSQKHYSLIKDYHKEYKDKKSLEARFVNACDKLEGMIHPLTVNEPVMNHELYANYADKAVKNFPLLLPFYSELKKVLKTKYLEWGFEWKEDYEAVFKKGDN